MTFALRPLVASILLAACSPRADRLLADSAARDAVASLAPQALAKTEAASGMARRREATPPPPAPAQATAPRKVIHTAQLRIELQDVEAARRVADSMTAALGGLVTTTRTTDGNDERREVAMTLRIPNERFGEALDALRSLGRVREDHASGDDVTRAYQDLEIRIAVKRDLVTRLRALVASRTARLSDVLEVERELARAVAELEQMEGERRFLDNQVAMATIHATFFHLPVTGPGSVLQPLRDAVREGARMLVRSTAVLVSLAVFLTPWVVVATVGWMTWRSRRRRMSLSDT